MSDEEKSLTTKQESAALVLATGGTQQEAATAAGVTDRTVRRWLVLPEFTSAIKDAESEQLRGLHRRLTGMAWEALDVLQAEMKNSEGTPGTRTRAALGALQYMKELRELASMQEQLDAIENRLQEAGL